MSVMEPVKKGFGIAGQSMNLVLVLFAFGVIFNLVNVFIAPQAVEATPPPAASGAMLAVGIAFILVSFFLQGGSLGFICEKVKTGSSNFSTFLSTGGKFYVRMLLLGLLVGLIVGIFVLLAALAIGLLGQGQNILGIVVGVIIAGVGIYVVMLMFLVPYFIVAADQKVIASVKQSMALVRKNLFSVIGIAVLLIVIGFLIGILLGVIFGLLSVALKGMASQVVFAVLSSFVNAFLGVLVTGSFMHFYLTVSGNTSGAK